MSLVPSETIKRLKDNVISEGICTGCGSCVGQDISQGSYMHYGQQGPVPIFPDLNVDLPRLSYDACPGKGINYPELYKRCWGKMPNNSLIGNVIKTRIGYANNKEIRQQSASGGVLSSVICHLLETNRIDLAILAKQGMPDPKNARPYIASNKAEIIECSQSVYIPVAMLEILREIDPQKKYAITCLPDQAASLRFLQSEGNPHACAIKYILGPYTGTSLYPSAIDAFMHSNGICKSDKVTSLKWRAGEWPGYLEIKTKSGKTLRSPKVYYNYLIPFFITQNSLQSMDFGNEFCDISVGDAWSPKFENQGGGYSVFTTRSEKFENIVREMISNGKFSYENIDPVKATEMHGHMIDFKKRGGYIRNRLRSFIGKKSSNFGIKPHPLPPSRWLIELIIISVFIICRSSFGQNVIKFIPEKKVGPIFNILRLGWKNLSKPTKRKGLHRLNMLITNDKWRLKNNNQN